MLSFWSAKAPKSFALYTRVVVVVLWVVAFLEQ